MIEPLLMATTLINTFAQQQHLTNATGLFFERGDRLFLVTSRHVVFDAPSDHMPDRLEIEFHADKNNLASSIIFSIPLYRDGLTLWREAVDSGGPVDIAAIEIERAALPPTVVYRAFTPKHVPSGQEDVEIGSTLLVVGFPLGFHDGLHNLPVVRQAAVASSFGLRFQGNGYFLTDARTHRGISGAPVVMRATGDSHEFGDLPWRLLGIHSSRLDITQRDTQLDEALGLNCTWYADVLLTLTEE